MQMVTWNGRFQKQRFPKMILTYIKSILYFGTKKKRGSDTVKWATEENLLVEQLLEWRSRQHNPVEEQKRTKL